MFVNFLAGLELMNIMSSRPPMKLSFLRTSFVAENIKAQEFQTPCQKSHSDLGRRLLGPS